MLAEPAFPTAWQRSALSSLPFPLPSTATPPSFLLRAMEGVCSVVLEPCGLKAEIQGSPRVFCCWPNEEAHAVVFRACPVTVPLATTIYNEPRDP